MGAKHADVHMMWAVAPEQVAEDAADMRRRAREAGRENLRFGLRLHVLCPQSKKEARRAAEALLEDSALENTGMWADQRNHSESEGQRAHERTLRGRLPLAHRYSLDGREQGALGRSRHARGHADMLAKALREYVDLGVRNFILSGWPHLEEAEIFGREVMPLLKDTNPARLESPNFAAQEGPAPTL